METSENKRHVPNLSGTCLQKLCCPAKPLSGPAMNGIIAPHPLLEHVVSMKLFSSRAASFNASGSLSRARSLQDTEFLSFDRKQFFSELLVIVFTQDSDWGRRTANFQRTNPEALHPRDWQRLCQRVLLGNLKTYCNRRTKVREFSGWLGHLSSVTWVRNCMIRARALPVKWLPTGCLFRGR